MLCMWVLQRGHSGYGCDLAWTLCKYNLRKRYLFTLQHCCFLSIFILLCKEHCFNIVPETIKLDVLICSLNLFYSHRAA